jgi:hypothetical protein
LESKKTSKAMLGIPIAAAMPKNRIIEGLISISGRKSKLRDIGTQPPFF